VEFETISVNEYEKKYEEQQVKDFAHHCLPIMLLLENYEMRVK
jgi:hypothetical protein